MDVDNCEDGKEIENRIPDECRRFGRSDTILVFSAVSPATNGQIGLFQRTSESSSDNPGFRVIARTKTSTRRSSATRAASAVTSGGAGGFFGDSLLGRLLRKGSQAGCRCQRPYEELRFPGGKTMEARLLHSESKNPHVKELLKRNGYDASDQKHAFVAPWQPSISTLYPLNVCGPKSTRRAIERGKM